MISKMESANSYFLMEADMKDNTNRVKDMVMGFITIRMDANMQGNGGITRSRAKE